MKINTVSLEILRVLIDKKCFINLKEIINKLDKFKLTPRSIQLEIKKLVSSNRVVVKGQASSTEYAVNEIQSVYRKYEFYS